MCLNIGTPKNINFSFETNGKLMALGVPILKHFRVFVKIDVEIGVSLEIEKHCFVAGEYNSFNVTLVVLGNRADPIR